MYFLFSSYGSVEIYDGKSEEPIDPVEEKFNNIEKKVKSVSNSFNKVTSDMYLSFISTDKFENELEKLDGKIKSNSRNILDDVDRMIGEEVEKIPLPLSRDEIELLLSEKINDKFFDLENKYDDILDENLELRNKNEQLSRINEDLVDRIEFLENKVLERFEPRDFHDEGSFDDANKQVIDENLDFNEMFNDEEKRLDNFNIDEDDEPIDGSIFGVDDDLGFNVGVDDNFNIDEDNEPSFNVGVDDNFNIDEDNEPIDGSIFGVDDDLGFNEENHFVDVDDHNEFNDGSVVNDEEFSVDDEYNAFLYRVSKGDLTDDDVKLLQEILERKTEASEDNDDFNPISIDVVNDFDNDLEEFSSNEDEFVNNEEEEGFSSEHEFVNNEEEEGFSSEHDLTIEEEEGFSSEHDLGRFEGVDREDEAMVPNFRDVDDDDFEARMRSQLSNLDKKKNKEWRDPQSRTTKPSKKKTDMTKEELLEKLKKNSQKKKGIFDIDNIKFDEKKFDEK